MRRQESFPWIIVMGGAVLYWTIALGIGIPSLYRLLGEPGPARRVTTTETRCVQAQTIDGTPVVFGDCINVRFLLDAPEVAPTQEVIYRRTPPHRSLRGPDLEVRTAGLELRTEVDQGEGAKDFQTARRRGRHDRPSVLVSARFDATGGRINSRPVADELAERRRD